jgi:hypothetical protein
MPIIGALAGPQAVPEISIASGGWSVAGVCLA